MTFSANHITIVNDCNSMALLERAQLIEWTQYQFYGTE